MASNRGGLAIGSVDTNPYDADPIALLEDEIYKLIEEVHYHTAMNKKVRAKGPNIHSKMITAKKKTLERLIATHPDGENTFLRR